MTEDIYTDLRATIEQAGGRKSPQPDTRYHRHREYVAFGLVTADLWRIMKEFRPRLLALPLDDRLDLAARLLADHLGELGHAAIYIQALSVKELRPEHYVYLDRTADDWRSWSHVDYFCGDVMRSLLERLPDETMALIEAWLQSPNRWKRRASIVTFTRKAAFSGRYTDTVLRLCDQLIWDPEDIVQKGVGWALKDNRRSAPDRIIDYVKHLRRLGVPSTITLYAIRGLEGQARAEVLSVKKSLIL